MYTVSNNDACWDRERVWHPSDYRILQTHFPEICSHTKYTYKTVACWQAVDRPFTPCMSNRWQLVHPLLTGVLQDKNKPHIVGRRKHYRKQTALNYRKPSVIVEHAVVVKVCRQFASSRWSSMGSHMRSHTSSREGSHKVHMRFARGSHRCMLSRITTVCKS